MYLNQNVNYCENNIKFDYLINENYYEKNYFIILNYLFRF